MAAAVLQIGDAEYPFTRGLFGWRAGDENVSFEGDGKCVFRGLIHYVTDYTLWLPRATIELLRTNDPLVPMPLKNVNVKPIDTKPDRPTIAAKGTAEVQSWCPACKEWHGKDHVFQGDFEVLKDGYLGKTEYEFNALDGKFYVGIHKVKFGHNGACQFESLDKFLLKHEYTLWVPRDMIATLRTSGMWKNVPLEPIEDRPTTPATTTKTTTATVQFHGMPLPLQHYVDQKEEDHDRMATRITELEEKLIDMTIKLDALLQTRSDDAPVIV